MKKSLCILVVLLFFFTQASWAQKPLAGCYSPATTSSLALAIKNGFRGWITIDGHGGATEKEIKDYAMAHQTRENHARIWIIQGGINSIKWYSGYTDDSGFWSEYWYDLIQLIGYGQSIGVERIYLQEMTPVIPSLIEAEPYWSGLDVPGKLVEMNKDIHLAASMTGVEVIPVYDAFLPHWGEWSENDSVHPNALGADHLATAWTDGIKGDLTPDSTIYIVGDSITTFVSPDALLTKVVGQLPKPRTAVASWNLYQ